MIKVEKIRALKKASNLQEFIHTFNKVFKKSLIDHLNYLELDHFLGLLIEGNYNKIRTDLEDMSFKVKNKILRCVEEGICDEVYEQRYRGIKELEDLITYFIEENYEVTE